MSRLLTYTEAKNMSYNELLKFNIAMNLYNPTK